MLVPPTEVLPPLEVPAIEVAEQTQGFSVSAPAARFVDEPPQVVQVSGSAGAFEDPPPVEAPPTLLLVPEILTKETVKKYSHYSTELTLQSYQAKAPGLSANQTSTVHCQLHLHHLRQHHLRL